MLSPFVDGELAPSDRQRVEQHLVNCTDCTGRVADLRAESGLVRVGMEMLTDDVDFASFSQKVMARLTPEKPPLVERLRLSLSEMFTYQRAPMFGALAATAGLAIVTAVWLSQPAAQPGYSNDKMAVQSVTTDAEAHVAPVVMQTEDGDSIIWVVDHAHVQPPQNAPDASQKEVDSPPPSGQKTEQPKGGQL